MTYFSWPGQATNFSSRADAAKELGEPTRDVTAAEVLSNIDAMSEAISGIGPGDPISVTTLLTFHQRLLGNTRQAKHAGRRRSGPLAAPDGISPAATCIPVPGSLTRPPVRALAIRTSFLPHERRQLS